MADNMIGAAPAGQPGTSEAAPVQQQPAVPQAQPQVNYVTSEQLNAAMNNIRNRAGGICHHCLTVPDG